MNKQPEESKIKLIAKPVITSRLPDAFYYSMKPKGEGSKKKTDQSSQEVKQARKKLNKITELTSGDLSSKKHSLALEDRYEDFVTLSNLTPSPPVGSARKVLKASTLDIFILESLPTSSQLKLRIEKWKQTRHSRISWISNCFWNTPEGSMSVVSEHCPGGSLTDLMEFVGSIPERALAHIAKRALQILQLAGESIEAYQVLFDREGKVKLGVSFDQCPREPVPHLAFLMLWAALGDKIVLEADASNHCCLFHALDSNLFSERFTPQFKEFLCLAFRSAPPEDLTKLQWFNMREYPGPDLSVKDLVCMQWTGYSILGVGQFEGLFSNIKALNVKGMPSEESVNELAIELGVSYERVLEAVQYTFDY